MTAETPSRSKKSVLQLKERDFQMMERIASYEGVMADYQLQRFFGAGERTTRDRLTKLVEHGYLQRRLRVQFTASQQVGTAYWLTADGWRSVAEVNSAHHGQARGYRRSPKEAQFAHDIAINDFRILVTEACMYQPEYVLEQWRNSGEFLAYPESVEFVDTTGRRLTRKLEPDGFFKVLWRRPESKPALGKFFLELDNGTEPLNRFEREKYRPGAAYLKHPAYAKHYEGPAGRWLIVVTKDESRLEQLMRQARAGIGADAYLFYFALLRQLTPQGVLTQPVWRHGYTGEGVSLLGSDLLDAARTRQQGS